MVAETKADLLIHVGAGRCREFPDHVARAERIVLVEPVAEAVERLKAKAGETPGVEIVNAALCAKAGARTLKVFNLADASGFREPSGLREIFPGLKLEREFQLDCDIASEFIRSRIRNDDETVALIIDVNGEEHALLDHLHEAGTLDDIDTLLVHCGASPLFEGAMPAEEIAGKLRRAGGWDVEVGGAGAFRIVNGKRRREAGRPGRDREASIPAHEDERTSLMARAEEELERSKALSVELYQARKAKASADAEAAKLRSALDDRVRAFETARRQMADIAGERKSLQEQLALRDAKIDELEETLETARREQGHARSEADAMGQEAAGKIDALEKELETLRQEHETLGKQHDTRGEELEIRREELAKARKAKVESDKQKDELQAELKAAREKTSASSGQVETLRKEKQTLAKQRDDLQAELKAAREKASASIGQVEALRTEKQTLAKQRDDLQAELKAAREKASASSGQVETLRAEKQALTQQRDAAGEEARTRREELANVRKAKADLEKAHDTLREKAETSARESAELGKQLEQARNKLDSLTAEIDALKAERQDAWEKYDMAKSDLALAMRMQSMAQLDLKSLQTEYQDVLTVKERQDDLLRKLTYRLREASTYLATAPEEPQERTNLVYEAAGPVEEPAKTEKSEPDAEPSSRESSTPAEPDDAAPSQAGSGSKKPASATTRKKTSSPKAGSSKKPRAPRKRSTK